MVKLLSVTRNTRIYNSVAVYYLKLQYVQTFHNIKHFNVKPHWGERSYCLNLNSFPHWSKQYKNDFLADTQSLDHRRLLEMALTRHIHSQIQRVEFPVLVLHYQTRQTVSLQNTFSAENATLIIRCVDVVVCNLFFFHS